MSNEQRRPCPDCGLPMTYVFPSNHPIPEIDGMLWRFQECRKCIKQYDVTDGKEYRIMRLSGTNTIQVNGTQYYGYNWADSVAKWVKKLTRKEP